MKKLFLALILLAVYPHALFAQNDITFQVNMNVQRQMGMFDTTKDIVVVRGGFNGWSGNGNKLLDIDGDGIYTGTFNTGTELRIYYKFVKITSIGEEWEGFKIGGDRTDSTLDGTPKILPVVWFSDLSEILRNDVTFRVNMKDQLSSGFEKTNDHLYVRGDFNNFSGTDYELKDLDGDSIYTGTFNFGHSTYLVIYYNFVETHLGEDIVESRYMRQDTLDGSPKILPVVWFHDGNLSLKINSLPDSLQSGKNYQITWESNLLSYIKIEYSTNNGSTWNLIGTGLDITQGWYNWQVPVISPASSMCKIKISKSTNGALIDESMPFTIYAKTANPIFSQNSGTYNNTQNVTITSSTAEAEIHFTLDGSEPTQLSQLYSQPIRIDSSQDLAVRAFLKDWDPSDIVIAKYTMKCATPVFSPSVGSFITPQTITITSKSDSVNIHYTFDGSDLNENSMLYTSPLLIDTTKTLKAKAFRKGWMMSDVKTGDYSINRQAMTVNFNTPSIWFDTNYDGKESRIINPTTTITYGSIAEYKWSVRNKVIGNSKDVETELPTGTWYVVLSMTSDRGIIKSDSVKISVYASEVKTDGSVESAVSELNENVYFVTSKGGNVYEFDSTGTVAWTIQTGGSIQSTTCVSSQDNIYVGSNDTRLYSFDYQGIPRWDKAMGGTIVSSPSVFDSLIYVGISTGRFFALNEAGSIKWSVQTGGAIYSSASIDENGVTYIGSNDGKLYAISRTGLLLWKFTTGGAIRTTPALGLDSSIVFGSDDGSLYKVDWNGNLKWEYKTQGPIKSSPIIGLEGVIYFGTSDGQLHSISKEGQQLWKFNVGSTVNATPALGKDGSIYVGSLDGTIHSIDQDGNPKWMLQTGKPIVAPMLVTNSDILMIGDTLGKVYIMKIPLESTIAFTNSNNERTLRIVNTPAYEWGTFKGNNQRTGNRKSVATSVRNQRNEIPEKFTLEQNFPNPFNPSTIIRYALPFESNVKLVIYNLLGEVVKELVNGSVATGYQEINFDATNLSSGIYFYTLHATSLDGKQNYQSVKKMLLLK